MRRLALLTLATTAACNVVFGLDEVTGADGGADGGVDGGAPTVRRATFGRERLTATDRTLEDRVPSTVRYLIRAPAEPLGYAIYPATITGASATATVPDGAYLLELSFDGGPLVHVASDVPMFAYRDRSYGRADVDTVVPAGTLVQIRAGTSRWAVGSELVYDTFGMWSHARAGAGPVSGTGKPSSPLSWNLPWTADAVATPPGAALGLLKPTDRIAITHREAAGNGAGWRVAEAYVASGVDQGPTTLIDVTLSGINSGQVDAAVVGAPLTRVRGLVPAATAAGCTAAAEVRLVPWANVGNSWGIGLGSAALDDATVRVGHGVIGGMPSHFAPRLVTVVDCPRLAGAAAVALHGEHATTTDGSAALPIPFATDFNVDDVVLTPDGPPAFIPLPTGAITLRWTPEAGLPAPDLYSVVVAAVAATPTPVFTALTSQPSIDVPAGAITVGRSYVVFVTAALGYPGFRAGDMTPDGVAGWTTTPSPVFVPITP